MKPAVKICGIASEEFAAEAAKRPIAYIGAVFDASGRSPRRVDAAAAKRIVAAAGGRLKTVGVFAGHGQDEILAIAEETGIDVVQLHGEYGDDTVKAVKAHGYEVWKLYGGGDAGSEDATLVDGRRGTESRLADWTLASRLKLQGRRVVLAGGLSAANIAAAAKTGADILDVSSSIETSPGVKSAELLDRLLEALSGK